MGMIRKLLSVVLAVAGVGLGSGAGFFLRPAAETAPAVAAAHGEAESSGHAAPAATEAGAGAHAAETPAAAHGEAGGENLPEYVKLANQFVVPLIEGGRVGSMVILSLSLEVTVGQTTTAFAKEPKLRDVFLQVMFDHANAGGFDGAFTDSANMIALRRALLEVAQQVMGDAATDVLITDIVRQDS